MRRFSRNHPTLASSAHRQFRTTELLISIGPSAQPAIPRSPRSLRTVRNHLRRGVVIYCLAHRPVSIDPTEVEQSIFVMWLSRQTRLRDKFAGNDYNQSRARQLVPSRFPALFTDRTYPDEISICDRGALDAAILSDLSKLGPSGTAGGSGSSRRGGELAAANYGTGGLRCGGRRGVGHVARR